MVVVPVVIPVTMPVVAPTVAIAGLALVHAPPGVVVVSVVVLPIHTVPAPPIGEGIAFTVTIAVTVQPLPKE